MPEEHDYNSIIKETDFNLLPKFGDETTGLVEYCNALFVELLQDEAAVPAREALWDEIDKLHVSKVDELSDVRAQVVLRVRKMLLSSYRFAFADNDALQTQQAKDLIEKLGDGDFAHFLRRWIDIQDILGNLRFSPEAQSTIVDSGDADVSKELFKTKDVSVETQKSFLENEDIGMFKFAVLSGRIDGDVFLDFLQSSDDKYRRYYIALMMNDEALAHCSTYINGEKRPLRLLSKVRTGTEGRLDACSAMNTTACAVLCEYPGITSAKVMQKLLRRAPEALKTSPSLHRFPDVAVKLGVAV